QMAAHETRCPGDQARRGHGARINPCASQPRRHLWGMVPAPDALLSSEVEGASTRGEAQSTERGRPVGALSPVVGAWSPDRAPTLRPPLPNGGIGGRSPVTKRSERSYTTSPPHHLLPPAQTIPAGNPGRT